MDFQYAIALTGGIATGKSTVTKIFSLCGFHFIDADEVAHTVLDEQHRAIAEMFGEELIMHNKKVDRKALGSIIFGDPQKRLALESLLHPLIYEEIRQQALEQNKKKIPFIIDIPLFFEGGRYGIEKSIVVYAPKEEQLKRLMQRDRYNEEDALKRIESQMDIEEKRRRATYVIDNSGDLQQLQHEYKRVKEEILKDFS
ncbi:dephospho-CoA kinase [Sulfurovum sp.]|uniref:dephospho-CoA kinase n=1 Tax=Sulfurovum sp. TaxID=1969726 RepID=UPI0025D64B5C|nr:dephospho-CoA kinase [Sulfurovum sp.]